MGMKPVVGLTRHVCDLLQTAEEVCGSALANDMAEEPYFVDFLRDAPEITGKCQGDLVKCLFIYYRRRMHWQ